MNKIAPFIFWIILASIIVFIVLGYRYNWEWVGVNVPEKVGNQDNHSFKNLWDWMEILIVPVVLSIGAWLFSERQKVIEEKQTVDRRMQSDYENYISNIWEILRQFRSKQEVKEDDFARATIEALTFIALKDLDPRRKGNIVEYLYKLDLIRVNDSIVDFRKFDLSGIDLENRFLPGIDLSGGNLQNANLKNTVLGGKFIATINKYPDGWANIPPPGEVQGDYPSSNLAGTNLMGANLIGAKLTGVNLNKANLENAKFTSIEKLKQEVKWDKETIFPSDKAHPPAQTFMMW